MADGRQGSGRCVAIGPDQSTSRSGRGGVADPRRWTLRSSSSTKGESLASGTCRASRRTRSSKAGRWQSLTATLFALLVKEGIYRVDDPGRFRNGRSDDPRAKIRIVDLLHMSSGLRFIAGQDPDYTPDKGYPDHR